MKVTHSNIIAELERLAEAFPWDHVDIWLQRIPEGPITFVAIVHDNPKFGLPWDSRSAANPAEAVSALIQGIPSRDPEIARNKKIAELKAQIEKLQQVVLGLPPYRPNRELGNGEPAIKANETVNV